MNRKEIEEYKIEQDDANQRLDAFLSTVYPDISRSYLQKQIKNNTILVNNKQAKPSQILKIDDIVSINFDVE